MHWAKITKTSALLSGLLAAAIVAPLVGWVVQDAVGSYREAPRPIIATETEAYEIITAVVDEMEFEGIPPAPPERGEPLIRLPLPTLVLSDTAVCTSDDRKYRSCDPRLNEWLLAREFDDIAASKLRAELLAANLLPQQMVLTEIPGTKVASGDQIQRLLTGTRWWDDFYEAFPQTSGYATVTVPVLTADRDRALVYIAHYCDGKCGTGTLLFLERSTEGWRVRRRAMVWIS